MGKKKIKKYRVSPNESLCLAVSVVDKPAVESEFVYLSEQKQENFVAVEKKERRMIYGCALRADYPIYRNSKEKGEYYLEFDAESIDKISKDFLKNGFQKNWTVGHEAEVENLSVCESWIKESPTLDKSIALGLDPNIPVGSWFLGCYCENDDVWNAVKEGKYHGFSIEAICGLEEFEKQIGDVDVEGSEAVKITPTKQELAEMSGFTSVEDYEKEVEAIKAEFEEATPTVETPVEPIETPVEPPKVEDPTTTPPAKEETPTEPENKPNDEQKDNHLEELIKNLQKEIEALKGLNKDLNKKVKTLEKEPSVNPINTNGGGKKGGDNFDNWRTQMEAYLK